MSQSSRIVEDRTVFRRSVIATCLKLTLLQPSAYGPFSRDKHGLNHIKESEELTIVQPKC